MALIKLEGIKALATTNFNGFRYFEVLLTFSDGSAHRWELSMGRLRRLGCAITRLSETKKLKDWIMGEGRGFFEGQVNSK
jgi:hypothetical protein